MRSLSPTELNALVNMATDPDYVIRRDDDPILDGCRACHDRGLTSYRFDGLDEYWDINDLGRLALRVHAVAAQYVV